MAELVKLGVGAKKTLDMQESVRSKGGMVQGQGEQASNCPLDQG